MKVIVGLGNPGDKYETTRHNVGFMTIDKLQDNLDFPKCKEEKRFKAYIAKKKNTVLLRPNTFMNNSGDSVSSYLNYYKIKSEDLFVIHDDVDLALSTVKISFNEGSAGHKGVESIIKSLGSKKFWRVRVGILSESKKGLETENVVLSRFSDEEIHKSLRKIIKEVVLRLDEIIKNNSVNPQKFSITE